jgi:heme/copper-type cytochrome/quinol oxidase subunit 2
MLFYIINWFKKWIVSTNHTDIGSLYKIFGSIAGVINTLLSVLIHLELTNNHQLLIGNNLLFYLLVLARLFFTIFFMVMPILIWASDNPLVFVIIIVSFSILLLTRTNWKFKDAATPWQVEFQEPATPIMEGIIDLHHDITFFIIIIIVFVSWLLLKSTALFTVYEESPDFKLGFITPWARPFKAQNISLKTLWAIITFFIVILASIPSFVLLYSADIDSIYTTPEHFSTPVTSVERHWYWEYQISSTCTQETDKVKLIKLESYMRSKIDLNANKPTLFSTTEKKPSAVLFDSRSIKCKQEGTRCIEYCCLDFIDSLSENEGQEAWDSLVQCTEKCNSLEKSCKCSSPFSPGTFFEDEVCWRWLQEPSPRCKSDH